MSLFFFVSNNFEKKFHHPHNNKLFYPFLNYIYNYRTKNNNYE